MKKIFRRILLRLAWRLGAREAAKGEAKYRITREWMPTAKAWGASANIDERSRRAFTVACRVMRRERKGWVHAGWLGWLVTDWQYLYRFFPAEGEPVEGFDAQNLLECRRQFGSAVLGRPASSYGR